MPPDTGTGAGPAALVTGGTSGIGSAIVERLAADGYRVAFTGRDAERGARVAARARAAFIPTDAAIRDADDRSFEEALSYLGGRVDLFVANAAIVFRAPLLDTPEAVLRELLEVNLTSPFRYSRACLQAMAAQGGGSIVHIASDSAIRGIHTIPAYSVAKAAVHRMSVVLAGDAGPLGVRVNAVCPGATPPGMRSTPRGHETHAENSRGWTSKAARRAPSAADVAGVVAWLGSDDSAHVSGVSIVVDGAASVAIDGGRT